MAVRTVHAVLAQQLGGKWRERFRDFDDAPAAAASIGQVHRATWRDGRDVAVKIQYPGAATALMSDLNQLARFARLFAALFPGLDVKPLIAELKARVVEELDYGLEADAQRAFAAAYAGDAADRRPAGGRQRAEGHRLGVARGHPAVQDHRQRHPRAARPRRAPPGRPALLRPAAGRPAARRSAPGQLPAARRRPARRHRLRGHRPPARRTSRADRPAAALGAGRQGRRGARRPARPRASSGRAWRSTPRRCTTSCGRCSSRWRTATSTSPAPGCRSRRPGSPIPASEASRLGRQLNLPPAYLLIHRVTIGSIGVLCQLDAAGDFRSVLEEWLPGFKE